MNKTIQESFDCTLKYSEFESLGIDYAELTIDSLLQDGLLKDLPVVSTLVGLLKVGANVRDKLFLKKLVMFLLGLNHISADERKKMIEQIDTSKEQRIKVGEKLLYILDSCSDHESAEQIAKLFAAFVENKISYQDFLAASSIIESITADELKWFVGNAKRYMSAESVQGLLITGLFSIGYEEVSVDVRDTMRESQMGMHPKNFVEADVSGGELWAKVSPAGMTILNVIGGRNIDKWQRIKGSPKVLHSR